MIRAGTIGHHQLATHSSQHYMDQLRSILGDLPDYSEPLQQRRSRLLLTILHVYGGVTLFLLVLAFALETSSFTRRPFTMGLFAIYLLSIFLLKQHRPVLSANVFILSWWLLMTLGTAFTGGLFTLGIVSYMSLIYVAGLLRGEWAAVRITVINVISGLIIHRLSVVGILPTSDVNVGQFTPYVAVLLANLLGVCLAFFTVRQLQFTQSRLDDANQFLRAQNEALQLSELRHRSMIEQSPFATIVFSAEGVPQYVNTAARHLWPVPRQVVAAFFQDYNILTDERFEKAGLRSLLEKGFRQEAVQLPPLRYGMFTPFPEHLPKDRGVIWLESFIYPLRSQDQTIEEVIIMVDDITDRVNAEQAEWQAQKLEGIGLLAGGIAHDFNNILTAIMAQASLAQISLPADAKQHRSLKKILAATEQAANLTNQLLAYAGNSRLEQQVVNLNTVVQQNLPLLQLATPPHVKLEQQLSPSLALVEADPVQIQQVVMNLLINGAEAISTSAGCVKIATKMVTLGVGTEHYFPLTGTTMAPGRYVSLEVSDNGVGMDSETIARIFEPFYSTKETGRGLGLSAVLGIIRSHQGAFAVESAPGEGTTFSILLPVTEKSVAAVEAKTEHQEIPGGTHILAIDDEQPVRDTITDILGHAGLHVTVAESGATGLSKFRALRDSIDLIILDLTMAGMNGEETLEAIRAHDLEVPVILSSGYDDTDLVLRLTQLHNDAFLRKPYTARELLTCIGQVLAARSP